MSADGLTKIIRTDTYGAYILNGSTWAPLYTVANMPAADVGLTLDHPPYSLAVAPSQSNRIYMVFRGRVYRSDDRAGSWRRTNFTQVTIATATLTDAARLWGPKMAVDPVNPDVVYVGTPQDGVFRTFDGGETWAVVSDITTATGTLNAYVMAFDGSSGTTGGRKNRLLVSSYGNGVYETTDAGVSFSLTSSSPTSHRRISIGSTGIVYLANQIAGYNKYASGTWSVVVPTGETGQTTSIAEADPFNASRVITRRSGGFTKVSDDSGSSWITAALGSCPVAGATSSQTNPQAATDIPWLAWTNNCSQSTGCYVPDPVVQDKWWLTDGIGVWNITMPSPATTATLTHTSISSGIEQLVIKHILSVPDGNVFVSCWDRPVFRITNPETYPSTHGPNALVNPVVHGHQVDYATDDPTFLVGIFNSGSGNKDVSAYSSNGGSSWTEMTTKPSAYTSGKIAGGIAALTTNIWIHLPSNNPSKPILTTDRGVTWSDITISGVPTTGENGWGYSSNLRRFAVWADKVTLGTAWLYNYGTGTHRGLYKTTDYAANWTKVFDGHPINFGSFNFTGNNFTGRAVPGHADCIFMAAGEQTGLTPSGVFVYSVDGGATLINVANVLEVYSFGFGRAAAGKDFPTVFMAGYVSSVWGIYYASNTAAEWAANAVSWTSIGDFPAGSFDEVQAVEGDMNSFGTCYVGFSGSGCVYRTEAMQFGKLR